MPVGVPSARARRYSSFCFLHWLRALPLPADRAVARDRGAQQLFRRLCPWESAFRSSDSDLSCSHAKTSPSIGDCGANTEDIPNPHLATSLASLCPACLSFTSCHSCPCVTTKRRMIQRATAHLVARRIASAVLQNRKLVDGGQQNRTPELSAQCHHGAAHKSVTRFGQSAIRTHIEWG